MDGTISYCYNRGDIKGNGDDGTGYTSAGGIVGSHGKAIYCYNRGSVYGQKGQAGGIIGNSYNSGITSAEYCYNTGTISGGNRANGSILGEGNNSTINYCYWTSTNNGIGYRGSISNSKKMTETELKAYTNDFFVEDADSSLNDGYPILKWQLEND